MRFLVLASITAAVLTACQCAPATGAKRCQYDGECPNALVCNTVDATCVECIGDANCASGLCLTDNSCSACGPKVKCQQGQVCGADGRCKDGCDSSASGCSAGTYCLPGSSTCVECTSDGQCGSGRVCDPLGHVCRPGCSLQNSACLQGLVCDADAGTCVGCLSNANCVAPQPVCDPLTRACVGCLQSSDCHDPALPVCDVPNSACVQCNVDPDCGVGRVCSQHTCVPGCSQQNPACPVGRVCNIGKGQCVLCNDDGQCGGATPRCDPMSNTCVSCLPGSDNCPVGQYCRPDFVCERGCKTGADCPSGTCLSDHSCSNCMSDGQCAAGEICQSPNCIAACSASNPCGAGKECCGMHCVDFQNDKNNCGGCGVTCTAAQGCCNGSCQNLDTSAHCGACGTSCNAGYGCCSGSCQSTTTLSRCGACNVACGTDQFCDGTACHNVVFPEFCANKNVFAIYDGITLDDNATNVLASTIAANCSQTTVITYGPQSNPAWVDQTTGALLLGSGATVVTAGGPFANKPVKWMERTSLTTKVYFSTNGIDTFYFKRRSDDMTLVTQPAASCSPHHDVLLVELARDPQSGTLALIGYGVCSGGYGTQAAGWYYANVMLPNRMSYPDSWYLFQWDDTNNDSLPNLGDAFMTLAHGM